MLPSEAIRRGLRTGGKAALYFLITLVVWTTVTLVGLWITGTPGTLP
ncbi:MULTISPECIES: hypothetical protein [unclassified Halorubrum]|nr:MULTISPECIES: hypothetical protein [unclassified Halorubrum]